MVGPGGLPFRRPNLFAGSSDLWVFLYVLQRRVAEGCLQECSGGS